LPLASTTGGEKARSTISFMGCRLQRDVEGNTPANVVAA
jgi:hypothetical protein